MGSKVPGERLEALAYRSIAARKLVSSDLDELLVSARDFNADVGVTGALFHHEGRFFQYIEGSALALSQVFDRISRSRLHRDIVLLTREPILQLQFEAWHMAFCEPPESVLQALSTTLWEGAMPITRTGYEGRRRMGMILEHWSRWCAESECSSPRRD